MSNINIKQDREVPVTLIQHHPLVLFSLLRRSVLIGSSDYEAGDLGEYAEVDEVCEEGTRLGHWEGAVRLLAFGTVGGC